MSCRDAFQRRDALGSWHISVFFGAREVSPYSEGFVMPVAFGFSVGDFIAGIKLLKDFFDALSDTHGAAADYVDLRKTLDALANALDAANDFTTPQHQAALENEVSGCKECVDRFLKDFAKFELLKAGRGRTSKLNFALLKVRWWRCAKDGVRKFRDHLQEHVSALTLQTVIFQM
jgi:hypothetical protein